MNNKLYVITIVVYSDALHFLYMSHSFGTRGFVHAFRLTYSPAAVHYGYSCTHTPDTCMLFLRTLHLTSLSARAFTQQRTHTHTHTYIRTCTLFCILELYTLSRSLTATSNPKVIYSCSKGLWLEHKRRRVGCIVLRRSIELHGWLLTFERLHSRDLLFGS